jgi:hypothetical protein
MTRETGTSITRAERPVTVGALGQEEPAPPWRADQLRLLCGQLKAMRSNADRADPLDETVLCLAESVALAAGAAELAVAEAPGSRRRRQALTEALAAARAAVVCMTYALAGEPGADVEGAGR